MGTWGEILREIGERAKGSPSVSPFDAVRRKYLESLRDHTKRNVILYATKWTGGDGKGDTSIVPEDVQGFMEVVHGLKGDEGLDLVLHSPGGSPEATEAIVSYLRSKFTDIRVIVPHAAMSAATMLATSANKIVLGKHSFLGPIDPQFVMGSELGTRVFAAHAILEQFELAKRECQQSPQLLASWLPLIRQYGPALLIQCRLALQLSESLVKKWLETYMFAGQPKAADDAARIAKHLADHGHFMSHSRFISKADAKALGLIVEDLESDQVFQDRVLSIFHATTHTMEGTQAVKIIENHMGKAFIKRRFDANIVFQQPPIAVPQRQLPPSPSGPVIPSKRK